MERARTQLGLLLFLFLVFQLNQPPAQAQCGGTERWAVKVGSGPRAASIDLSNRSSIDLQDLIHLQEPSRPPVGDNTTRLDQETHGYVVRARLAEVKSETDNDDHMVITDDTLNFARAPARTASGQSLVAEIPDPNCISGKHGDHSVQSAFISGIQNTRKEPTAQFPNIDKSGGFIDSRGIPVQLVGAGFFGFPHEQAGRAPNNIEMHPVLDVVFHPSAASTQMSTPMALVRATPTRAAEQGPKVTARNVHVEGVASDGLSLDVRAGSPSASTHLHLAVDDLVVKDRVKQLQVGDQITVVYSPEGEGKNALTAFSIDTASPGPAVRTRVWVLAVSALATLLLYCFFSGFDPRKLMIGEDNRYSNSKFQISLWFFVLITTYIATLWLRVWYAGWDFLGGINVPQNLLLISGMSVFTFGGAKAITTSKAGSLTARGNSDPKPAAPAPSFLQDLTSNDGQAGKRQLDFGDFQMFVITLIAVATYMVLIFHFLGTIQESKVITLPDVDTTILAVFGLSHGAYLTKKAVGDVGKT